MSVTIKDVAREAGCSIKTVSRVVNNEPYVTDTVRGRVLEAIQRLGYAPNISARRLVSRRAYGIGFLLHSGGLVQASMVAKILETGYEYNYDILPLTYFPARAKSRNKLASLIGERRIDGLITTPPADTDDFLLELVRKAGLPLVQIDPFTRSPQNAYVAGDDYQGAQQMTDYLIGLGHRRIAYLTGPRNHRATLDRLYGYRAALERAQIPFDPQLVIDSEFNFPGGYTGAKQAIMTGRKPSAIFAGADEAAWGALFAAQEMGYSVPGQLSVVGYGDLPQSQFIWPGLTTVCQPLDLIVEKAIQMLIENLAYPGQADQQILIPSRLVIRASAAAPTY